MNHFNIFILRECLTNIFGTSYPKEIIMVIMTIIPRKIRISCGQSYSILHKYNIYGYGANECGQLGLGYGDSKNRTIPTGINLYTDIESIVCGWDFTVAFVSNSKELYFWGCELKLLSNYYKTPIKLILNIDSNIKSIKCGRSYIIVLTQSGKCYSWGRNAWGQLGLGHVGDMSSPREIIYLGSDIIKIECGSGSLHCIAVAKSGKCYTWGSNNCGQLGLGNNANSYSPKELLLQNIVSIGCGYQHTIVTTIDTKIYVWGDNQYGQLGLGHDNDQNSPQELLFPNIKIESVSCGFNHTMVLTTIGKLYIWGKNDEGQLGLSDYVHRYLPQEVYFKEKINSICGGASHTLCTTSNGKIYTWGDNDFGQLGLGRSSSGADNKNRFKPRELKFFL